MTACTSEKEVALSALHHFNRGNEAFQAEDYSRSITHFRSALDFDPSSPDIHYNLGLAYYKTDNFNDSVLSFQQALKLDPELPDAHYNLALAYDKLYNPDAAHNHYNRYRSQMARREEAGKSNGSKGVQTARTGAAGKSRKVAGRVTKPSPRATRQAAATQAPPREEPLFGGNQKWWTQDRFIRKP